MPQRLSIVDCVTVAAPLLGYGQKTLMLKIPDYFLDGSFRDAHFNRNIPQASPPVFCQANQYVTVVAEKSPITHHMPSK
jgi:hypothetical protein